MTMNKRDSHRPIDASSSSEAHQSFPTPTSSTPLEPQGSTQQNVVDASEQWVYSNDPNDPLNFQYMVPTQESNVKRDVVSDGLPLPRGSKSSKPLADEGTSNDACATTQNVHEPKRSFPKQLPEAMKYLVPASVPDSVPQITNDPIWDLSYQQIPYGNLPLRQDAPQYLAFQVVELQLTFQWSPPTPPPISYSSQPIDFSNPYLYDPQGIFSQPVPYDSSQLMAQPPPSSTGKRKNSWNSPSRSPEPRLPGTRKTAQPKRRRQQSPGSGSDDSDADVTLCWRCRKYNDNHPGNKKRKLREFGSVSGTVYVWPFVQPRYALMLDTANMEDHLRAIPRGTLKTKTWRMWSTNRLDQHDFDNVVFRDHFVLAQEQALSTNIFDHEYAKLLSIAQSYQEATLEPNKALETSCRILIECCELYKCFINTSATPTEIPILTLLEKIRTTRSTMRRAFREYQALALSPSDFRSRRDWLPSFLSACMLATSAVVYIDMMIAIPSPYKERIWGVQWHERVTQIRHGGYGMMLEVLRANTKNVNPLELSCWVGTTDYGIETTDPYAVGSNAQYVDLGVDSTNSYQNYDHLQQGENIFAKDLYRQSQINPIAGLWRIFDMR
ncbi:hypothetical protein CJF31_00004644 [Rutstroemia sp. NJR-2017a BVV2]|nr:hypothetical protein CJF31_00004644 [Rutstroemia sp. NJR-2017a BVV2]